jgi:hypothetical protein
MRRGARRTVKILDIDDVGDGKSNTKECGLSSVLETEHMVFSDNEPEVGFIIMYRTTTQSECGDCNATFLWERAKILSVGDTVPNSDNLKEVTLRMNPATSAAVTKDVALGSHNCGDGSSDGQIWFRVVNKADLEAARQVTFVRDEKIMMKNNDCAKVDVAGDGHCHRRAWLVSVLGKGSDSPMRLRQLQSILAVGLEDCSQQLDELAVTFAKENGFKEIVLRRSDMLRRIDSSKECSREEWGGGDHGCDNFVLSTLFNSRILISTPNSPCFHVYNPNFMISEQPIRDYVMAPGDVPMSHVWSSTHFVPYVRQGDMFPFISCLSASQN